MSKLDIAYIILYLVNMFEETIFFCCCLPKNLKHGIVCKRLEMVENMNRRKVFSMYSHFHQFPECFQRPCTLRVLNLGNVLKRGKTVQYN